MSKSTLKRDERNACVTGAFRMPTHASRVEMVIVSSDPAENRVQMICSLMTRRKDSPIIRAAICLQGAELAQIGGDRPNR
jgi:hypothetical protein